MKFKYELWKSKRDIEKQIKKCEGKHLQQVVYSTYHGGFTQICFDCLKIRTNIIKKKL